jgi:ABC-type hemin transport system substrate-binding protein
MQSRAGVRVSHVSEQRTADAVLRTRVHRIAEIDDNAEEGVKVRNQTEPTLLAFRGCSRKSITGILLMLYLTVPDSAVK